MSQIFTPIFFPFSFFLSVRDPSLLFLSVFFSLSPFFSLFVLFSYLPCVSLSFLSLPTPSLSTSPYSPLSLEDAVRR